MKLNVPARQKVDRRNSCSWRSIRSYRCYYLLMSTLVHDGGQDRKGLFPVTAIICSGAGRTPPITQQQRVNCTPHHVTAAYTCHAYWQMRPIKAEWESCCVTLLSAATTTRANKGEKTNEDPKPAKAYLGILHTKEITHSIIIGFMMLANCWAFFTSSPLNAIMLVLTGMGHRQHHLTPSFGISGSPWKQPKHTGNNSNSHMSASLRKQFKQSHVGISPETTQTVTCRHLSGNNPVTCRHLSGNNPNSHMLDFSWHRCNQSQVGVP